MKIFSRIKTYSPQPHYYLFAVVLLARVMSIARLSASPLLLPARGDMQFYNDWSHRILQGELTSHFAFYGLPLYAYLLALIYKIFGYSPFVPAFLQAILEAGTAVLIYRLTTSTLGELDPEGGEAEPAHPQPIASHLREMFGLCAGLGWAFFVPAEAYSIILMPTAWLVFVFWLVVWQIARTRNSPRAKVCLWLGLLIGFTAMGIATILFLVPLIFVAVAARPEGGSSKVGNRGRASSIAIRTALLLLGVVIGCSPCWIHNYFVAKDPVALSAHSGINFWIGNNPDANGYPRFPPGLRAGQAAMLEDSITSAESAAGRPLKRSEVSRYWSAKAKAYITHHLRDWLVLLSIKIRNFASAFQYDDLSVITILREQRVIFPGLSFGIVAALAVPGAAFGYRSSRKSRWILFAILLHMAALTPVFVTERYRLAAVPGLLVFATTGLWILWHALAKANYRSLAVYAALLIAAAVVISWPQRNPSLWALDAYNAGWQALESDNLPLAEQKLSIARAYVPDNTETDFAFGNLRLAQGNLAAADRFYRETLALDPNHKGALNNLGVMAFDARNFAEARSFFERSLTVAPRNAKTCYLLARTSLEIGAINNAQTEISKAIKLGGALPEFTTLKDEIGRRSNSPNEN